jgi:uncharacterized membrane protein (DUF373 family)
VSVGVDIFDVVSVVTLVVESVFTSVLLVESPPQAARNADRQITISTFFILISLEFYNLFLVYTLIPKK